MKLTLKPTKSGGSARITPFYGAFMGRSQAHPGVNVLRQDGETLSSLGTVRNWFISDAMWLVFHE